MRLQEEVWRSLVWSVENLPRWQIGPPAWAARVLPQIAPRVQEGVLSLGQGSGGAIPGSHCQAKPARQVAYIGRSAGVSRCRVIRCRPWTCR